jgi:hypothetical protein
MKLTTPPSSAEIENVWRYAFAPPNIFMAWYLIKQSDNFVFTFMMCVFFFQMTISVKAQVITAHFLWRYMVLVMHNYK